MENLDDQLKDFRFKMKVEKRWSDLDEVAHVNNAVYLTYFEQARGFYFYESCKWDWKIDGVILASNQVDYIRPILYLDPTYIYVRTSRLGTKSLEVKYIITNEYEGEKILMSKGSSVLVMYDYKTQASVAVPEHIKRDLKAYEPLEIQTK